jgi:hypothetical protein
MVVFPGFDTTSSRGLWLFFLGYTLALSIPVFILVKNFLDMGLPPEQVAKGRRFIVGNRY